MSGLDSVDGDALRAWLDHVDDAETARWLALGIAADEGVSPGDLAAWYGLDREEVQRRLDRLAAEPLAVTVAQLEGVDLSAMADAAGLGEETVTDWFAALDARPVEEAADIIARYGQRETGPLLSGTESRVRYLDYGVLDEHGWSIDDPDLFEKASEAGLDPDRYGRFLVEAGETILEAAESRGISWPYACRGGACANCAAIVRDGDVAMPGQTILSDEQIREQNARLTCVGVPVTDQLDLVMNVQHLEDFEDLRLPSPMAGGERSV
ncbi:MAG: ferredoxin Fer [Halobacteriales archaeon]